MITVPLEPLNEQEQTVWSIVGQVPDPEIPVLTLADLGIIRSVSIDDDAITIGLAPTYSGCPATEFIEESVIAELQKNGFNNIRTERVLSPAWTTDWISQEGRRKLQQYGIVPPDKAAESKRALFHQGLQIACPRCASDNTSKVSEFGSTPCKASYKCDDCLEPFEYFKCL
jgi:ring-1,2-phenylacetyl-CoA epoxidase subunit PaaD